VVPLRCPPMLASVRDRRRPFSGKPAAQLFTECARGRISSSGSPFLRTLPLPFVARVASPAAEPGERVWCKQMQTPHPSSPLKSRLGQNPLPRGEGWHRPEVMDESRQNKKGAAHRRALFTFLMKDQFPWGALER